jgi:hypothetical protein
MVESTRVDAILAPDIGKGFLVSPAWSGENQTDRAMRTAVRIMRCKHEVRTEQLIPSAFDLWDVVASTNAEERLGYG